MCWWGMRCYCEVRSSLRMRLELLLLCYWRDMLISFLLIIVLMFWLLWGEWIVLSIIIWFVIFLNWREIFICFWRRWFVLIEFILILWVVVFLMWCELVIGCWERIRWRSRFWLEYFCLWLICKWKVVLIIVWRNLVFCCFCWSWCWSLFKWLLMCLSLMSIVGWFRCCL